MKRKTISLFASITMLLLVIAAPAAAETRSYRATFVEIDGDTGTGQSCGSATISQIGHVAHQCIQFDACGINCHERTITFDDGSSLLMVESVEGVIMDGESAGFLEITQTIAGGTGRFDGATGSGSGTVNLNSAAVIVASGTIALPDGDDD